MRWTGAPVPGSRESPLVPGDRQPRSDDLLPYIARGLAGWLIAAVVASLALPADQQAAAAWIAAVAVVALTLRSVRADRRGGG